MLMHALLSHLNWQVHHSAHACTFLHLYWPITSAHACTIVTPELAAICKTGTLLAPQAPMVPPAAPTEDSGLSMREVAERFQKAELAISPAAQSGVSPLPPRTAADYLLAAHHPVITQPLSHRRAFW